MRTTTCAIAASMLAASTSAAAAQGPRSATEPATSTAPAAAGAPREPSDASRLSRLTLSPDERSMWLSWPARSAYIGYPDDRPPFDPARFGETVSIAFHCRTGDAPAESLGAPRPLSAVLLLPPHPDSPNVYNIYHPVAWWLLWREQDAEIWPARATIGNAPAFRTSVERRRVSYSFLRPPLQAVLSSEVLRRILEDGRPAQLRVEGTGLDVRARFETPPDLVAAGRHMARVCPADDASRRN